MGKIGLLALLAFVAFSFQLSQAQPVDNGTHFALRSHPDDLAAGGDLSAETQDTISVYHRRLHWYDRIINTLKMLYVSESRIYY